ncbi:MAG: hypothetical protein AAB551_00530 [Patescibacteria group bacterium]
MKHFLRSTLLGLVITLTFSAFLGLKSVEISSAQGTGGQTSCPVTQRYTRWGDFIRYGTSFRDWGANWKDIFGRNACQRDDILAIQKNLEGVRHDIRTKIFNCSAGSLDSLIATNLKLETELEYVRSAVSNHIERTDGNPDNAVIVNDRDVIYNNLKTELVFNRKLYNSEVFDEIFLKVESDYSGRIADYVSCSDPTFEELSNKWNNFVESAAGIKPAWDKLDTTVQAKWKNIKDSPSQRSGNYLGGFLDIKLNGLNPQQTLGDIVEKLSEISPSGAPSFLDTLNANEAEQSRYFTEQNQAMRLARYEAIYANGSDDVAVSLAASVVRINSVIKDTFPVLKGLGECVSAVASKQCANK